MEVFQFLYNDSCCESAYYTVSIHSSYDGAVTAMEAHKQKILDDWTKDKQREQEDPESTCDDEYWELYPWDFDQGWKVVPIELLP